MISQKQRIKQLFLDRSNEWVPLPDILDLRISQFGARILDLRREGYNIINKKENKHSWYKLVTGEKQMEFSI